MSASVSQGHGSAHDPLCRGGQSFCDCPLIARVREDERTWLAGTREADLELARTKSVAHFDDGYAAALRDAVEAVKALPPHWGAEPGTWDIRKGAAVAAIEALGGQR